MKRTRQRVDAGEPRNTYSSISQSPAFPSPALQSMNLFGGATGRHSLGLSGSTSCSVESASSPVTVSNGRPTDGTDQPHAPTPGSNLWPFLPPQGFPSFPGLDPLILRNAYDHFASIMNMEAPQNLASIKIEELNNDTALAVDARSRSKSGGNQPIQSSPDSTVLSQPRTPDSGTSKLSANMDPTGNESPSVDQYLNKAFSNIDSDEEVDADCTTKEPTSPMPTATTQNTPGTEAGAAATVTTSPSKTSAHSNNTSPTTKSKRKQEQPSHAKMLYLSATSEGSPIHQPIDAALSPEAMEESMDFLLESAVRKTNGTVSTASDTSAVPTPSNRSATKERSSPQIGVKAVDLLSRRDGYRNHGIEAFLSQSRNISKPTDLSLNPNQSNPDPLACNSSDNKASSVLSSSDIHILANALKSQLIKTLNTTVDQLVAEYMKKLKEQIETAAQAAVQQQQQQQQQQRLQEQQRESAQLARFTAKAATPSPESSPPPCGVTTANCSSMSTPLLGSIQPEKSTTAPVWTPPATRSFYAAPSYPHYTNPFRGLSSPANFATMNFLGRAAATQSIFPPFCPVPNPYFYNPGSSNQTRASQNSSSSEEAVSLVVPKKRRSKVTDTRIGKMTAAYAGDGEMDRYHLPTMVTSSAFPSVGCQRDGGRYSPYGRDEARRLEADELSDSQLLSFDHLSNQSATLSPVHLRKAKLIFFYTRYPSSALLKAYFPDINFNKNNTAQLVKWFSNFREFYYIQMEKYARQALAQGITRAEDISVTTNTEIYRVLNVHYNRNSHIQPPPSFRVVVEATLREFFKAIQANRDTDPSWKKVIYKVINRMDDQIPESFKDLNFLEHLNN